MGIFRRLQFAQRSGGTSGVAWRLYPGQEDLEVVGEAHYQDELWSLCGGSPGDCIRHDIVAVLIPEPENPHDVNAISVRIDGKVVGYLPRQIAALYVSGLRKLMSESGSYICLQGVIVGGGYYNDGPGRLGVWLARESGSRCSCQRELVGQPCPDLVRVRQPQFQHQFQGLLPRLPRPR